ncbi:MAG: rod shape-determining protein MreD [Methyloprofundus sp.]|nr:rod shape-determining protein MreD [Methyloprofundus sp.]
MVQVNKSRAVAYWLTVGIAMVLRVAPWSPFFSMIAPDWILLALIYWALATPEEASVGKAWIVGLLADVLTGQLLGQYALTYTFSIFLCAKQHKRIRNFPVIQQSLSVFVILFIASVLLFWIEHINHQLMPAYFWLPVLTGTLVWPVVYMVLSKIHFR